MAFIPATNVAEVVVQQELAGQVVDNVLNFLYPAALSTTDLTDLNASVITNWITHLAPIFTASLALLASKATDLTTSTSPSITTPTSSSEVGDRAVPPTSNNVAIVVSERTDSRGRSFRGRSYLAGLDSTERTDAATISTDYQAEIVSAFSTFIAAIETATGAAHVVLSRFSGGSPRVSGVPTEIVSYSANRQLDSQRRRLSGRGS